ncbi:hypothetical protein P5673_012122, partial [Acropora cervicornis]
MIGARKKYCLTFPTKLTQDQVGSEAHSNSNVHQHMNARLYLLLTPVSSTLCQSRKFKNIIQQRRCLEEGLAQEMQSRDWL